MMARLRQCGGFFSLISKDDKPMWTSDSSSVVDAGNVDALMSNSRYVHRRICDMETLLRERKKCFGLEHCNCMIDFLTMTRDEFSRDNLKERLFGKAFLNIDCPSVVRVCFRCVTMGQTFNDDFTMDLRMDGERKETHLRKSMQQCLLTKVRLLIMCFIHRYVLGHYLLRHLENVQDFIGNRVFFHDRLVQCFIIECEERETLLERDDIFVVFDVRKTGLKRDVCVFVLIGEYLREGLQMDLMRIERDKALPTTFAMTNNWDEMEFEYGLDASCTHSREIVVNKVRIERGMVGEVERCNENRFRFLNTVGGLLLNKQMDERQLLLPWNKVNEVFDVFHFLLALFCEVFNGNEGGVFHLDWTEKYEVDENGDAIRYCVKDLVCSDGEIRRSIKYECDSSGDLIRERGYIRKVYQSPVTVMAAVQIGLNSIGHFPRGSPKQYYKNHVYYEKEYEMKNYEDRGYKHLYEGHHKCNKKKYCTEFCKVGLGDSHYKRRDYYQVENEEMSCRDTKVDYEKLDNFLRAEKIG